MENKLNKAYEIIENNLQEALSKLEFEKLNKKFKINNFDATVFKGKFIAYGLSYNNNKKLFELYNCSVENESIDEQWINVSSWLFDPDEHTIKDAKTISSDFIESVSQKKKPHVSKKTNKKNQDDKTVDSLFLINRLANIWPQIKNDIKEEKENYEQFRSVTFVKEIILDKFQKTALQGEAKTLKKLGNVLSDMYKVGNLDVRGIITIVLLNSLEDSQENNIKPYLSEELQKAYKYAKKIKGKKIKPEKPKKKKKSIFAETLRETANYKR